MNNKTLLALLKLRGKVKCTCGREVIINEVLKKHKNFVFLRVMHVEPIYGETFLIYNIKKFKSIHTIFKMDEFDSFCRENNTDEDNK